MVNSFPIHWLIIVEREPNNLWEPFIQEFLQRIKIKFLKKFSKQNDSRHWGQCIWLQGWLQGYLSGISWDKLTDYRSIQQLNTESIDKRRYKTLRSILSKNIKRWSLTHHKNAENAWESICYWPNYICLNFLNIKNCYQKQMNSIGLERCYLI